MLTVAHVVEESCKGTQVLCTATQVEQVRINTLEFIHNRTDICDALIELNTHSLFDDTYQRMTVHHGTEIVHTVGKRKGLRICV